MANNGTIRIICDKKEIEINIDSIIYIMMNRNFASIHLKDGKVYQSRMTLSELETMLDGGFIKIKRGCLVSMLAIHDITDRIHLSNGETLEYAVYNKEKLLSEFHSRQRDMINAFAENESAPETDLMTYYKVFDSMPIAFADIEMVFDDQYHAVDWVFRYGNPALAELEKMPLESIIGNSFATLFPNMDTKWLQTYERATLFGETLKIIDYSPEVDTYLDIICFPTFKGHCGCILFDISKIKSFRQATNAEKALSIFFERLLKGN